MPDNATLPTLKREIGLFGAIMMGMGSIVGSGVFVSIGIAAGIAGPAVLLAIALAALVATCNALNSAQLAANHPVSGGTYAYGYKYLNHWFGFSAGWLFLCAKTASAATAAMGFAAYLLNLTGQPSNLLVPVALATVLVLTALVLWGLKQSNWVNIAIVSVTLLSLLIYCLSGLPKALDAGTSNLLPFFLPQADSSPAGALFHATALAFVSYTGYGRIATMGEEVHEPRRTIPRAIVITLWVSALIYLAVGVISVAAVGTHELYAATKGNAAPLEHAARLFNSPAARFAVSIGAMTAMLGVLLNMILGLSRMLFAMGRQHDMPRKLALVNAGGTPVAAVITIGVLMAGLTLVGSVKTTWSFSAFTVLIYYAITNLAALKLPPEERLYSPLLAWLGLAACVFLAFFVEWEIWVSGLGLILMGLIWHAVARRMIRQH